MAAVALSDVVLRSPRIVSRRIAGELVLVPLVTHGADLDAIYNLNAVGAFIWERLDGRASGDAIVAGLAETFEVESAQAAADYLAFVSRLVDLGVAAPAAA
jgi:hypothetical protein